VSCLRGPVCSTSRAASYLYVLFLHASEEALHPQRYRIAVLQSLFHPLHKPELQFIYSRGCPLRRTTTLFSASVTHKWAPGNRVLHHPKPRHDNFPLLNRPARQLGTGPRATWRFLGETNLLLVLVALCTLVLDFSATPPKLNAHFCLSFRPGRLLLEQRLHTLATAASACLQHNGFSR
jgi:hypothetical protein